MKIIAYFTSDATYYEHYQILKENLLKFTVDYHFEEIEPNSWLNVTSFKPKFIKSCLEEFQDDVLYVDIDCVVHQDISIYFNNLEEHIDIAVHKNSEELLSGVIFFRNSRNSRVVLDKWIDGMEKNPHSWDQKILENLIIDCDIPFHNLPTSFLYIFDKTKAEYPQLAPVIEHLQASREKKFQEKNATLKYKLLRFLGIKPRVGKYLLNRRIKMEEIRNIYLKK